MIKLFCAIAPRFLCDFLNPFLTNHPLLSWWVALVIIIFAIITVIIGFLAKLSPWMKIIIADLLEPFAKNRKFKKIRKITIKANIDGNVNAAVQKLNKELPKGWIKEISIDWVEKEEKQKFLDDEEIVIRMRPYEDQGLNFVNALYHFLKKSFFPKTKSVVPSLHQEASVLFIAQRILSNQKKLFVNLFNEKIFEGVIRKNKKVLDTMERYKKIDKKGFFTGAFLREIHAVAVETKYTPLRYGMKNEVENVLSHIEKFIVSYEEGNKKRGTGEPKKLMPEWLWSHKGPVTGYALLLIANPTKVSGGTRIYVNRARENVASGVNRLYVFGSNSEREFAEDVINAIQQQVPELELYENFPLQKDYRGDDVGLAALFVKTEKIHPLE